jgi:hypothetical protein
MLTYRYSWHHVLKGKFLQHKRNRRVDHLLFILFEKAIPHYKAKHLRQQFGFEGPDLEVRRRQDIEERARTITKSSIEIVEDGYRVASQSEPGSWYHVDLDAYTCDCDGFPVISFCKHLSAVQNLFPPEVLATHSLSVPCTTFPIKPSITPNSDDQKRHSAINPSHDLTRIGRKLLELVAHRQTLPTAKVDALLALEADLDLALADHANLLPKPVKIAPNQHSWTETAAVMGARPKTKRKQHEDPYGAGERSGKKAKPDARAPKK